MFSKSLAIHNLTFKIFEIFQNIRVAALVVGNIEAWKSTLGSDLMKVFLT